jgi:hypothetical protein
LRVYTKSASRKTRRNGRLTPQQKCRSTAGRSGARARTTGMPTTAEVEAQLAASGAGTCNQALEANAARCFAVATKTSASAWGFGRGFSKVNRIFTVRSTSDPSHLLRWSESQPRAVDSRTRNAVSLALRNANIPYNLQERAGIAKLKWSSQRRRGRGQIDRCQSAEVN